MKATKVITSGLVIMLILGATGCSSTRWSTHVAHHWLDTTDSHMTYVQKIPGKTYDYDLVFFAKHYVAEFSLDSDNRKDRMTAIALTQPKCRNPKFVRETFSRRPAPLGGSLRDYEMKVKCL